MVLYMFHVCIPEGTLEKEPNTLEPKALTGKGPAEVSGTARPSALCSAAEVNFI